MLSYALVDVFAAHPYAGNPLAVVHGADDLTDAQRLAVARELNLSETTFPVVTGPASYDVRIFTPGGEIPFAGHPTLGTAWVLRDRGELAGDATQRCGAGDVDVRFAGDRVELAAAPRDHAVALSEEDALTLLHDTGLAEADLAGPAYVAGAGLNFVHLPVRPDAVGRAHPSRRPAKDVISGRWRDPLEGVNLHAIVDTGPDGLQVRSRVFLPGISVPEDPATGAAAAGLGLVLVAAGLLPAGGSYSVTQGVELGRPSLLECRVEVSDGRATRCHVGGLVQRVGRGELVLPPVERG